MSQPDVRVQAAEEDALRTQAAGMVREGARPSDVMRELGLSRHQFYAWFPADGTLAEQAAAKAPLDLMQRLRDGGLSDADISRRLNVSRQHVSRKLGNRGRLLQRSLVAEAEVWERLEEIARSLNLPILAEEGNPIRDLLVLIGRGHLHVTPS